MDGEWYKSQVETKHRQRKERIAREAVERTQLEAAEKAAAAEVRPLPGPNSTQPGEFDHLREAAERARRGESEKGSEPLAGAASLHDEKASWLRQLAEQYRAHPDGIRRITELRIICTACGSHSILSIEGQGHRKVCSDCSSRWYAHHCKNCNAPVDSRDPENPRCDECGGYRCAECDACEPGCKRVAVLDEAAALVGQA